MTRRHDPLHVTIVGTGYVGLSTAAMLAYLGHSVTGLDTDEDKIRTLREGRLPIYEPHLAQMVEAGRSRLSWTTRYEEALPGADAIFICVGTPPAHDGSVDLCYVRAAATQIAKNLSGRPQVVVNKSTVPIGTSGWVWRILCDHSPPGRAEQCDIVSNPEFLREGSALADGLYPDRIVLGSDSKAALDVMQRLYAPLLDQSFPEPPGLSRPQGYERPALLLTTLTSAEMIKYAANAFLAMKISFANEVAGLCEHVGADVLDVMRGIGYDSRIGHQFLSAGAGWGGSCFGKDTQALVSTGREYHYAMPMLESVIDVNRRQRAGIIAKVQRHLKRMKGRRVAVLGLAFKPHTDDLRDAPSRDFIERLHELGAFVTVHDPVAMPRARAEWGSLTYQEAETPEEALAGAEAAIIATEWPQYERLDWNALAATMANPLIVDARNVIREPLAPPAVLEQVGRAASMDGGGLPHAAPQLLQRVS